MPPNVLIFVLDAARAGNFSAYGHRRETSPNTDALAEEGRLFERAVPPAPATFDSVTSFLSGTYPCEHQSGRVMEVSTSRSLLPEVLSDRGYTTGFATSSPGTTPAFGYGAGVDEFHDVTNKYDGMNVRKFFEETKDLPKWRRYLRFARKAAGRNFPDHLRNGLRFRFGFDEADGAQAVTAAATDFISTTDDPWFLYLHYTETHMNKVGSAPYAVPDEFLRAFTDPDAEYDDLNSTSGEVEYTADQVTRHERLYDGAIRYLDAQIGEVVDVLRDDGAFDDTLIVVTSDHGEVLGETGYLGHGTLDEPVLRVPLVVRGPGVVPDRISERVNLVGLYRTLTKLGGEVPDHARGSDLLSSDFEDGVLCQNFTGTWDWSTYDRQTDSGEHAFYRDNLKLVSTPDGTSLYDVERDPEERTDLEDDAPDRVDALTEEFQQFVLDLPTATKPGEADIDGQTEDRLRELGYLS